MSMKQFVFFVCVMAAMLPTAYAEGANNAMETVYPQQYSAFWETAPPFSMVCAESLPLLRLGKTLPMQEYEVERLRRAGGFTEALTYASKARDEIEAAKSESTLNYFGLARFPLYQEYVYEGIVASTFVSPNPLVFFPVSCLLEYSNLPSLCMEVKHAACAGMKHSAQALAYASYSAEEARAEALQEAAELQTMGAGCPEYSGPEKAVLFEALRSLNYSKGFTDSIEYTWMVHSHFNEGNARFQVNDAYPIAFNSMVGGDGVVASWINVAQGLRAAKESMRSNLKSSLTEYEIERSNAMNEFTRLKDEGYMRIDYREFSDGAGEARGSLHAENPSESLRKADAMIRDADYLVLEANSISRINSRNCYLSDAIIKVEQARVLVSDARALLTETENETLGWLEEYRNYLQEELHAGYEKLYAFNASAPGSAELKKRAGEQLGKAADVLNSARFAAPGEKAQKYSEAKALIESAKSLLSTESANKAELTSRANSSISRLERAIQLAEKDGIDCTLEREFASLARQSLDYATVEDLLMLGPRATALTDGLYAKAKMRYAYLDSELLSLSHSLNAVRAYASISGNPSRIQDAIDMIEGIRREYCVGNGIDGRLALGNFKNIEKALHDAEGAFNAEKDKIISDVLAASADVSCALGGTVVLDEEAGIETRILLENPFPFNSTAAIRLELKDKCNSPSVRFTGDGFTFAKSDGRAITMILEKAGAHAKYSLVLHGQPMVYARQTGNRSTITAISQEELSGVATIRFAADCEIGSLAVVFPFSSLPNYFDASAVGGRIDSVSRSEKGIQVLLSRVKAGEGTVTLYYSYSNPYSVEEENWNTSKVNDSLYTTCFDSVVKAYMHIPAFNVSETLYNISAKDANVRVLEEDNPIEFQIVPTRGGARLEWMLDGMSSGEERQFHICYDFQNMSSYAAALLEEAWGKAEILESTTLLLPEEKQLLENGISEARDLINSEDYQQAVALLQKAIANGRALERVAGERAADRDSFTKAQGEYEEKRKGALEIIGALETAKFTEEAGEMRACISAADLAANDAQSLAVKAQFREAGLKEAEALERLSACVPKKELSLKAQQLSEEKTTLEAESLALARFGIQAPGALSEAGRTLDDARKQLNSEDTALAVQNLYLAKSLLENASVETKQGCAAVEANLSSSSELFRVLKPEAEEALRAFYMASTVGGGRVPRDSKLVELSDERSADGLKQQVDSLAEFFSAFSSSRDKKRFILEHTEESAQAIVGLGELNKTAQLLTNKTGMYESLAEELLNEAELRLAQANAIVPQTQAYAEQLKLINESITNASASFAEKRFADSIVSSEKAIADSAKLLNAVSQVEQNKKSESSFQLQPVYILLPALLLALAVAYFKGRTGKKDEPKRIPKIGPYSNP